MIGDLERLGWCVFDPDDALTRWVAATRDTALGTIKVTENRQWFRCGGTWFAGVNVLPNDAAGCVAGGIPLQGTVIDFLADGFGEIRWDKGQVSVVYPGYPIQQDESDAAFRFRRDRDAAHVDGVLRQVPDNRRYLGEAHAFVLGIPITQADSYASPMVVWEGSHKLMETRLMAALKGVAQADWATVDVTETYQQTRRVVFETCSRRVVHVPVGGAYLIHRYALHGVAPWKDGARADRAGRAIVYFRPEPAQTV